MSCSPCNNHRRQSSKHIGHNIETCYHCNKSTISISTATIANIDSVQPMALVSAKSTSSGSTITIFTVDL